MVARTVKIVEPFRKIYVLTASALVHLPGSLPRLVGLVFSRNEAPIVTVDLLEIEEMEELSLKAIANKFGYNEKYLSHALHELTGVHFCKLVNFYRIDYAKKLLKSRTDESVTVIAMKSGFSSTNTFYRVFLQTVGSTPSEYRRHNKII